MLDFVEFLSSDSEDECFGKSRTKERHDESDFKEDLESEKQSAEKQYPKPTYSSKPKGLHHKKQETVALIKQLRTHAQVLEKEKNSQFYGKKKKENNVEYKSLQEMETKLNQQRKIEYENLKENLNRTINKLDKFKCDRQLAHKNNVYLEKLKILMEDIEAGIMQFKERQKIIYADLMGQETNLTTELENYSRKFEGWFSRQAPIPFYGSCKTQSTEKTANEGIAPKEVETFEKFLQATGGHYGGWDEYDHQTFLKLHKQHKKQGMLLNAAISDIPTHSTEEIEDHIEWHKEYSLLRGQKREAIRKWKKLKKSEREQLLSNPHDVTDIEEKRKIKREELFEKERQQRLAELKQWKTEQQQKNDAVPVEDEDEDRKHRIKMKQVLDEKRRLQTKLEIQEYRLKKKEEEEILRIAKEEQERRRRDLSEISTVERSRIKDRNERLLEQKRVQQLTKELEIENQNERLKRLKEKVVVNVERDPARLYKPTEGWKRRQQQDTHKNKRGEINTGVRALPHRAVPSWRQGVS